LYVLAYLAGGFDIARHSLKAVLHLRFDIDFLMIVAAIGAAIVGEWPEGAFLLFLFSLGHALEHYATGRARRAIRALGEITPKTARVLRDSREQELPVEKLERGDLVIVRNGERIPVDGVIKDGRSAIDQSPITGESMPVEKQEGDDVFAGSVNGDGALEIEVTKLAKDTTLARVVQMVEEAQTQKSPTQRFTEKFESRFVPAILIAVIAMILTPPLIGWLSWKVAFLRAMAMLVAASPCALAIATPSAVLSGIARAARTGVLIKGGVYLENLGTLKAIAFDKTGTITRGEPAVTDIMTLNGIAEEALLQVAAAVESRSGHPLAQAIVREAEKRGIDYPEADEMTAITGRGVRALVNGETIHIGNLKLFTEMDGEVPDEVASEVQEFEAAGKTTMVVRQGGKFIGVIDLADQPRAEAKSTLSQLKQIGIKALIMITGDNQRVAAAIAEKVGLTEYKANLLPEDKVSAIKEIQDGGQMVAMVGDGVNDAPAMKNATVGIAMGASGADVALETADVALMADDLSKLPFAVALSREARRTIKQNLVISLGVIAMLLPTAMLGLASIGIAVIFHEGSTLLVVGNALRLLRFQINQL
ncbi:MAG: heavy metal translocating P-type ATPase, partial [bacterium]